MKFILFIFSISLLSACGNTIYIVRHAEKAKALPGMNVMEADDPPLSDSGNLRALALKERLKGENIRYIYSTKYRRTINTAKPLDEYLLNVKTEIYNAKPDSAAAFIARIKMIKKGNVLIVGHSNTIDNLANLLCGSTVVPGDLKDSDYDNLFRIRRKGQHYIFKGETYGAPTE